MHIWLCSYVSNIGIFPTRRVLVLYDSRLDNSCLNIFSLYRLILSDCSKRAIASDHFRSLKLQDELEITSKRLGQRGRYSGTHVLLRNKVSGEIIAEGRHSLFRSSSSKL